MYCRLDLTYISGNENGAELIVKGHGRSFQRPLLWIVWKRGTRRQVLFAKQGVGSLQVLVDCLRCAPRLTRNSFSQVFLACS